MSYKRSLQRAKGYAEACKAFSEGKATFNEGELIIPGVLEIKKDLDTRKWNVRLTTPNGEIQEFGWNGEEFYGLEVERHPASCHFRIGIGGDPEGASLELIVPVKRHMYFHVDYEINQAAERIVFTEKSDGTRYGVAYTVESCQYNNLPEDDEIDFFLEGWVAGFQNDPDIDYSQYKLNYGDQELPERGVKYEDTVYPPVAIIARELSWGNLKYKLTDNNFSTKRMKVQINPDNSWIIAIKNKGKSIIILTSERTPRSIVRIDKDKKGTYLTVLIGVKDAYIASKDIGPCCGFQFIETEDEVKVFSYMDEEVGEAECKRIKNGKAYDGNGRLTYSLNPDFEDDYPVPPLEEMEEFKSFS